MAAEYTVKNNDFSAYDSDPMMTLDRIDRNNTHYYTDSRCPKCGGKGYLPGYEHVEGGVCFLCGGSGRHGRQVIVRTEEYNEKLTQARLERARKTAGKRNAEFLKSRGFSVDGFAWIVMGNTFEIKDQLKAAGARYDNIFGWHFDHEVKEFPTVRISIEDKLTRLSMNPETLAEEYEDTVGYYYNDGTLSFGDEWVVFLHLKEMREKWEADHAPKTEWYGSIKDKVDLSVKLIRRGNYDTMYGVTHVYTFEDAQGYQLVWKTGTFLEQEVGAQVNLKGTIKAHSEYKGIKQTELTRCKVA